MKVGNTYSLSVIKYSMLFDTLLWRHVYEASSCLPISIFMTAFSHIATGTHMPYGITRCYLPPDRADIYPSRSWYLIKRSWSDARLSWPSLLLSLRVKKTEIGEYLAKLQARAWLSRAFCTPGQHTAKRRRKCTRLSPIESPRYGGLQSHWADIHGVKWRHIIYDHVRHFVGITWHNVWS